MRLFQHDMIVYDLKKWKYHGKLSDCGKIIQIAWNFIIARNGVDINCLSISTMQGCYRLCDRQQHNQCNDVMPCLSLLHYSQNKSSVHSVLLFSQ